MKLHERNQMVLDNLPLVGYLVSDLMRRAPHLSREDLYSVGSMALITSANVYNSELGVPFGAFARQRVIGAFADDMRSSDWATRQTRGRIKSLSSTHELLTSTLKRSPTVDELASATGMTLEETKLGLSDSSRIVTSIDEKMHDFISGNELLPEESVLVSERITYLRAAVKALPDNMRRLIEQLYFEDRTVKEIAEENGVTHSAISQQRSEAIRLMRDGMDTHYSDAATEATLTQHHSKGSERKRVTYISRFAESVA